jgi:hypothetical protein
MPDPAADPEHCCDDGETWPDALKSSTLVPTPDGIRGNGLYLWGDQPGVKFRNVFSLSFTEKGKIRNLINDDGLVASYDELSTCPKLVAWH